LRRFVVRTIGLFEAKQRLSEIVERAAEGERIGITRRGMLAAVLGPARPSANLEEILNGIEEIRKQVKPPRGFSVKSLIEEGRR
jgi:prevent-host-death family protein